MTLSKIAIPKYNGVSICNILPSFVSLYSIKTKDKIRRIPLSLQFHKPLENLVKKSIDKKEKLEVGGE
jgi:hypothetical protein